MSSRLTKYQKRIAFQQLVDITSIPGWEKDQVKLDKVKGLRLLVGADTMSGSKPLPDLEFELLIPETYLYLRQLGYQVSEISKACNTSHTKFSKWLSNNKLTRKYYPSSIIDRMEFSRYAKKLPLKKEGKEMRYVVNKEKINEFLQDHQWSSSTQAAYRGFLRSLEKSVNQEITSQKIDVFLEKTKKICT